MPRLNKLAEQGKTVVIWSFEGSNRNYIGGGPREWHLKDWMNFQNWYNSKLQNIVSKFPRIYFSLANSKTTHGPNGEELLPDGTHKIIKGGIQNIPPSLMSDLQRVINLHCNRKIGVKAENVCCT